MAVTKKEEEEEEEEEELTHWIATFGRRDEVLVKNIKISWKFILIITVHDFLWATIENMHYHDYHPPPPTTMSPFTTE